jgi:AraC family transcriptional regulator
LNWIAGIQHAIDYIEENLTQELDYEEIAKQAYSSSFHFQRVFGILCGYTLGEYIRARRLTLAGMELAAFNSKVIDVALKYGYDNPESFGRAFTKFHGIMPSQAKSAGANLKVFSKLSVKLTLEGGHIMDYRIKEQAAFKVIEKVKSFSTKDDANFKEIPEFWRQAKAD